ncbi:MAG TPA: PEP/pyruvate-binding domain-containing protein [Dissulfurispiraceae bacterium]|nr:PEP/pyruvate-binding domain-containing protein [Dissulfurispiraceae bacterium]
MKKLRDMLFKGGKCIQLKSTQSAAAKKYVSFKTLLKHNNAALNAIAEMEKLYYSGNPFTLTSVRIKYEELIEAVTGIIYALELLTGRDYSSLSASTAAIDSELFREFNPRCSLPTGRLVMQLENVTADLYRMVGSKAANLASIRNILGLPAPPGFVITALAFERFLQTNKLLRHVKEELSHVTSESIYAIESAGQRLRAMILESPVPNDIMDEIRQAYSKLEQSSGSNIKIAMRSSAVGEDTEATFAGQYDTVLNVSSENISEAYKTVLASKYSARAIAYRLHYGLDERETPMCVLGIAMVDSKASGVVYSVDPTLSDSRPVRITSIWGIGEHLVAGNASPDIFIVDRFEDRIINKEVTAKASRLVNLQNGGTDIQSVPVEERMLPSLNDQTIIQLAKYGLILENYFAGPQDIEWAIDERDSIFILQSRPLHLPDIDIARQRSVSTPENPLLLKSGKTASGGISTGTVCILGNEQDLLHLPDDAIVVAKIASPDYAKVIGRIKGIITDIGSVTSHMSSVAREFAIPCIVDAGNATDILTQGEVITLWADATSVYRGIVEDLAKEIKPAKKVIFDSPIHRRMRGILDHVSPLNLIDADANSFSPAGCRTFHDIVRFTHETAIREMFGLSETSIKSKSSVKLSSRLPMDLWIIDLGNGLQAGLTTCDKITPDKFNSVPMKAVWRGFAHPGVSWEGTMSTGGNKVASSLAAAALSEFGEISGGDSYALLSEDYLNLSVRFAYHFATMDTLCGDNESQNYISLQFSGGAGNYYGRSLRIQLMGSILERLGFRVAIKGDLLSAAIARYDKKSIEEKLDMVARLLASTRLLDMTLTNQDELDKLTEAFFSGTYDFLAVTKNSDLPQLYIRRGHWGITVEDGRSCCLQDGSRWGKRLSSGISRIVGKIVGDSYHEFLDTIEAYHYCPLAIVRDGEYSEGCIEVNIKPISGKVDRAGGIAFGITDIDNYFVMTSNSLEGNMALYQYVNRRKIERLAIRKTIETGKWHTISVEVRGRHIKGYLNSELAIKYETDRTLKGYIGLWTKADSVICFDNLAIESNGQRRVIGF